MTTSSASAPKAGMGALDRALAILDYLASSHTATTNDLITELGLRRSTAYRIVDRLREREWLSVDPVGGGWHPGPAALRLASVAMVSSSLVEAAGPILRELLTSTQETVGLAVPSGIDMVFIHRERGPRPAAVSSELGSSRPMDRTSVGRSFLAALPDDALDERIQLLVDKPESAVTADDVPALRTEIAQTRSRGWAQDRREFDVSTTCCGAPIRDHSGQPLAAISVAGIAERMKDNLEIVGPQVAEAAARISRLLGYTGQLF